MEKLAKHISRLEAEKKNKQAIKKDEKTVEEERETIILLIRDSFFINVESK